jgi:hypothetical protein
MKKLSIKFFLLENNWILLLIIVRPLVLAVEKDQSLVKGPRLYQWLEPSLGRAKLTLIEVVYLINALTTWPDAHHI